MFVCLNWILAISSVWLGILYYRPHSGLAFNRKIIICGLWSTILLCTALVCTNRATLGLVFNVHAPDVDFMQTINPDYIILLITNFIYFLIIYGIYFFLRKKLGLIQPVFLALFLVATILIYYPGISSADGTNSYQQFQSHLYSDWQPPIFTIWWNIFHIEGATFLMNVISYYLGLIAISVFLYKKGKNWQNDILVLFSLNPLLFTQLAIIWKDIGYTAFLVDCIAIYLYLPLVKNGRTKVILWSIYFICLFLATGFRINGVLAALPLVYAAVNQMPLLARINQKRQAILGVKLATGLISLAVIAIFIILNNFITYKVFDAKKLYAPEFVMVSDMAYIECSTNHEYTLDSRYFTSTDPSARNVLCEQSVNEYNFDPLYNDWGSIPAVLKLTGTEEGYQFSKEEWLHALANYPGTYMVYRARFLTNDIFFPYWYPTNTGSPFADKLAAIAQYQHFDMKFILALFMIDATITTLVLCLGFANYGIAFIIISSCIAQLIGWYFFIPAHAARYFLWNYIGALLSLALIGLDKKEPQIKTK